MIRRILLYKQITLLTGLVLSCLLMGCGEAERPDAEFHGTISLDGKPLTAGSIQFTSKKTGEGGSVNLNADGTYSMKMPQANIGDTYSVLIGPEQHPEFDPLVDTPPEKSENLIPPKYSDRDQSELKVELKQPGKNEFNFDLSSE